MRRGGEGRRGWRSRRVKKMMRREVKEEGGKGGGRRKVWKEGEKRRG